MYSNQNMAECISFPSHYIQNALDRGLPAVAFTEHGNILSWVSKKNQANEAGLKFIHGIEIYVTDSLDEKIRDNNHLVLIAKNYEGVKEINRLSSAAFTGKGDKTLGDNHFYYNPRLSFEEVEATSDNVLIFTACLGSPFYQAYKKQDKEKFQKWVEFAAKNKHRVWLEVQPHDHPEQKVYNKILLGMAAKYDMNIVATNDVHAHDEESDQIRKKLMQAKGIYFEDDDENTFELWDKDYDEMVESFKKQGVLTDEQIQIALDETMVIADMIEDFEFDREPKYPHLFENSDKRLKDRIVEGFFVRGFDKMPPEQQEIYKARVNKELADYKHTGSDEYILLEDYVKSEMRKEGRLPGYGRGSVTGSLISYLLQITEVDPIKEDLSFERFINRDRVNLADVDSDWSKLDRQRVQEFLLTHPDLHCSAIVTYNTMAIKGAIKEMGRSLHYDSATLNAITSEIVDENDIPKHLYEEHKELMYYAEKVIGVITSVGRHAAGIIVTDRNLIDEIGAIQVADFKYPVSAIDMKEVDSLNYVKLDVLGLDNIGLIKDACDLAGLPFATPQSDFIDFQDEKVWKSMAESNVAIFQFDATERAGKILKEVFSDSSLNKIKDRLGDDVKYMDLLSLANAAQRPAGASFIEDVMEGNFTENGHESLNDFLKETLGNLVYQEQQIKFLTDYTGRTAAQADLIRRAIGKKKKEVINEEVPRIREDFIATMQSEFGDSKDHAEEIADAFMQIFLDAADYSFSKNHSVPYSYIGYISAWLRYYYPLEFLTAALEIWNGRQDKTNKIIDYAKERGIQIKTPKFRYSKGGYFFDKEGNTIYQGTAPLKENNAQVGDMLYENFRDRKYEYFTDFLLDVREMSTITCGDNTRSIREVFLSLDEDGIKNLDKAIKASEAKHTYSPYEDKTLRNNFVKWVAKEGREDIQEAMELLTIASEGEESVNVFEDKGIQKFFDDWRFNIFKGKKKWEEYENAQDFIIDKQSFSINKTKMTSLIRMNYFEEFGGNKKLQHIFDMFDKEYKPNNKAYKGKREKYLSVLEFEKSLEDESYTVVEQCEFELYYTGRVTTVNKNIPKKYAFVTEIMNVGRSRTSAIVYSIHEGVSIPVKVAANVYRQAPFEVGDLVEIQQIKQKPKPIKEDGQWKTSDTLKETWIEQLKFMRKYQNGGA